MRCWSPLTSTRCEPDRLVSVHPSRFSAASTRAALAMDSTVNEGPDKTARVPAASGSRFREIHLLRGPPQSQEMMIPAKPASAPPLSGRSLTSCGWRWPPIWPAFKGSSREHTESDLRCY